MGLRIGTRVPTHPRHTLTLQSALRVITLLTEMNADLDEIRKATKLLESIVENRTLLSNLPQDERKKFLIAAGRVSRPSKIEITKICKTHRKQKRRQRQDQDRAARSQTLIRKNRKELVFRAPLPITSHDGVERNLQKPKHCYVCKSEYVQLHFFYDAMCIRCGDLNYEKRFQSIPLDGRVALITGGRLKIGYQTALMLLRAGATVLITTRFPKDCAIRFSQEEDFSRWRSQLQIHGLDLRHSPSVETFAALLRKTLPHLDILINNAAQTVRRPPGFYKHLMDVECASVENLSKEARALLGSTAQTTGSKWVSEWYRNSIGLSHSALLSQVPYAFEEPDTGAAFPQGSLDADLQQVDLRKVNSWRLGLGDVSTPEMIEVQLVNSIAPFILCSKLKPLFLQSPHAYKFIVNVSAMEGKFHRFTKTDKHPHTNMAKAALNMLTLTSARDYAKDAIYMTAVDTGWVTDEDPAHLSARKVRDHDFEPPLDIVDGAARICDPIFSGLKSGEPVYGCFLKDYAATDW